MNDDELRRLLREAHAGDDPPDLGAQLARARTRETPPRRLAWLLAPVALAAAVLLLWQRRAGDVGRLDLRWSEPTAFLLDVPGTDFLKDTPRFELKGFLR